MTGEQERQTEMVVWRCPECGWYWVDGDTVEDDAPPTCDRTLNPAEYPNCGKMQRIPVLPASAVEELVRAGNALYGQVQGYRGYGAHSTGASGKPWSPPTTQPRKEMKMAKCSNCEGFGYTLTPSGDDADTQLVTNCKECDVVNDCPGDNG